MASPTTPLPFELNFHLRQAVGGNRIVGREIGRPHHAAHGDGLMLGVDLYILRMPSTTR